MNERNLGKQGLKVSAIGLGCMGMSEFYGRADESASLKTLALAIELNCSFWDTADIYGPRTNERLLAKALRGKRDKVILATKFGIVRDINGGWLGVNGHPDYVKRSCEASLRRLNTDYIDLYYQHRVDPTIPIEDTVGAMADLVKQGKVRYLGLSEADSETIERAHNVHPISALQTEYSLWSRDVEGQILDKCRQLGVGFVAYSPLGRGFLSGKVTSREQLEHDDWRRNNPRFSASALAANAALVHLIEKFAATLNITKSQLCLAWVLAKGNYISAIPGTKSSKYLRENVAAMDIKLPRDMETELSQACLRLELVGERY